MKSPTTRYGDAATAAASSGSAVRRTRSARAHSGSFGERISTRESQRATKRITGRGTVSGAAIAQARDRLLALGYNLVRLAMARVAARAGVAPTRVSYRHALQFIRLFWLTAWTTSPGVLPRRLEALHDELALLTARRATTQDAAARGREGRGCVAHRGWSSSFRSAATGRLRR